MDDVSKSNYKRLTIQNIIQGTSYSQSNLENKCKSNDDHFTINRQYHIQMYNGRYHDTVCAQHWNVAPLGMT